MKKIVTFVVMVFIAGILFAQTPQKFNYQAVVRNTSGDILANQDVSFRISILQGSSTGFGVYSETHNTLTNQFGLVTLEIGNGMVESGLFNQIKWSSGLYYLKIEIYGNGGNNYQLLGISQLLSVPYAIHASSLTLTDENGNQFDITVDTLGNLSSGRLSDCGNPVIDERDGQSYNTIKIGNQCWMRENLNIGLRKNGTIDQTANDTIEKYCYNDLESNCDTYGGLYQWNEIMEYETTEGSRGICPTGWHIPKDEEWKQLEGEVDSLYGYPDPEWDNTGNRGYDAGYNLKSASGWYGTGNGSDLYGFSALPAGFLVGNYYYYITSSCIFWTSTQYNNNDSWYRQLWVSFDHVTRNDENKNEGFSVRCIKDFVNQPPNTPSNPKPEDGSLNIEIDTVLSWSCSDPENEILSFDVYFGTIPNPPLKKEGITNFYFIVDSLDCNTTYHWKITAQDNHGNITTGPVWNFSTTPLWECNCSFVDIRDGQSYSTAIIGDQCWMAENLNIGIQIIGSINQSNNGYIEKYCYDNLANNCNQFGGLYQWNELMQYSSLPGQQGICPDGWHIPTDEEWKQIEGEVDSLYNYPNPIWENIDWRGYNAGGNLKHVGENLWVSPNIGATNSSGFSALPGGYQDYDQFFYSLTYSGYFWTSDENNDEYPWCRGLNNNYKTIYRNITYKNSGLSVRCIK